jgi:hypothetical protein
MLYGSVARGTEDSQSDIDVLELVPSRPRSYKLGEANVTQYVPAHLHVMATQGSLFVLHLRQDGVVLADELGVLRRALDAYTAPTDYRHLWEQLAVAAGALDDGAYNFASHAAGLGRLGVYILRTAAYVRSIELGHPEFDVGRLDALLGDPGVSAALAMRRQQLHSAKDVVFLRRQIERLVPHAYANPHPTVESYAVANSTHRDLAALFAAVLNANATIDYSSLSLPPF